MVLKEKLPKNPLLILENFSPDIWRQVPHYLTN